jgi:hypothetical protein
VKFLLGPQDTIINTSSSEPETVSCEETQIPQRKAFPDMNIFGRDAEEAPQEPEEFDNEATNQYGVCNLAEEMASEISESTVEEEHSTHPYTSWRRNINCSRKRSDRNINSRKRSTNCVQRTTHY